jgi:hypothetical protein
VDSRLIMPPTPALGLLPTSALRWTGYTAAYVGGGDETANMPPVRLENSKLFTDLTFLAFLLMLDQRTFPSSNTPW